MNGIRIDTTPLNPIYLEMGAAVQDSQRLELYISFIVTLLIDLSGGTLSDDEFRGWMDNLGNQTLGRLIEEIKRKVGFTDEAVETLRKALRSRNFLIHRFYNARSGLLLNQAGREKALLEIGQKRAAINRANAILDPVMNDLIRLKGIDVEQIKNEIQSRFEA
jgi:cell division GTPase FtsZ